MPITDTLKTAEDLRRVGFTDEQSTTLATKLEETAHAQSEDLKSFIRGELGNMEARLDARIESLRIDLKQDIQELRSELKGEIQEVRADLKPEILEVRVEMHSLARDQLLKFVTIMALMFSMAVAIIKLFPDLY